MQIDPRLLATTMLAISIDNDGRFVGVHLGDSDILWNVGGSDLLKTVSSPQRGDQPNSTYLTMNCPLFYYLRFLSLDKNLSCQKDHPLIRWNERPERATHFPVSFLCRIRISNQKMINTRNFDDMSYVLCELDAPVPGNDVSAPDILQNHPKIYVISTVFSFLSPGSAPLSPSALCTRRKKYHNICRHPVPAHISSLSQDPHKHKEYPHTGAN